MCMIEHVWRDSVRPQFANLSVEKVIIILYARGGGGGEENTIPCNWKEINRGYKLLANLRTAPANSSSEVDAVSRHKLEITTSYGPL